MQRFVAIDTETALIEPGNLTPALTCVSFYNDDQDSWLLDHSMGWSQVKRYLESDWHVIGHNIAYDLAVLEKERDTIRPFIWKAYDEGRIHDTKIRQQLIDISVGELGQTGYSLSDLSQRFLGSVLDGKESTRLQYGELRGKAIAEWSAEARRYALKDAETTFKVFKAQEGQANLHDEAPQCRAAWALHLMSVAGMRTDPKAVEKLSADLRVQYENLRDELFRVGILRIAGSYKNQYLAKDTKAIQTRVAQVLKDAPKTKTCRVSIDADTLTLTGDPILAKLVQLSKVEKLLKTYVPVLEAGTKAPINARFNVLVESGRTSCAEPNLQNLPRRTLIRECFVARPGHVFISSDYDTVEMRAMAQIHLWWYGTSALADAFKAGKDPHAMLAAQMTNGSRQAAKMGNYGLMGGMSAKTLRAYARGFGITLSDQQAKDIYRAFFETWPEMVRYLADVKDEVRRFGKLVQAVSGRERGRLRFTSGANTMFQGLVADGAKAAAYAVSRECYLDNKSELYGCVPVVFPHDELLVESPKDRAEAALKRLSEVMVDTMAGYIPEVPIKCSGRVLGERWSK